MCPLGSRGFESFPQSSDPQDSIRVVTRRTSDPRVLPSPLLAPKMIACEISFGGLNDNLATSLLKIRDLVNDINSLRFKLNQKLAKVAKAAGAVDALDEPF